MHHNYQDYLHALAMSNVKLEYCDGEVYAMAGGTAAHAELAAAATRLLGNALFDRCRVFSSDLKVRIEQTDLSTFPDVTVVCGPREFSAQDMNALTNPTLLVEVTSHSTEDYDRGEKLSHYRQLDSLRAVLFISHRMCQVTLVEKTAGGWQQREYRSGERLRITVPECELAVDDLYDGIELDT
jgi:Uma2 family endonuclease